MKVNTIFSVIFLILIAFISVSNIVKSNTLKIVSTVLLIIVAIIFFIVTAKQDRNNRR